jgi:transposase-like protein
MERISILQLVEQIPDEASAYRFMEKLRWPDKPICPHCGSINDHRFLNPENGTSRRTRTGTHSQRRVWKCRDCQMQFSVITGTPFHGSKVPLRTWVFVLFEMCANKNGIAAREIQRKYGVTAKTAWFMTHRVREAMKVGVAPKFSGTVVVADETWIGGEPKNMQANKRPTRGKGFSDQTPVLSLVSMDLGKNEVRSQVVPNVKGSTLRAAITEQADLPNTTLFTDSAMAYRELTPKVARHVMVNHKAGQYVKRGAGTNAAENYFSQLKRSIDGTFHHVSVEHLPRYLAEFDFRYSTHQLTDTQRMQRLMGQTAGRRLHYKPLTSR